VISVHDLDRARLFGELAGFRGEFYRCLGRRADALFELTDAVLCTDGPVKTLVELALAPEHRRGYGALYDGLNSGRIDVRRLRAALAGLPLPRAADGRIVLAVDVSAWLRPDAATCPDRLFCHTYGRGKGQAQMIPGWPYSFVAALETGRTSWTAVLDAVRLGPDDDEAEVTAGQVRDVVTRLGAAGQWRPGDPDIWIVVDSGYDVPRLAFLLADLPVQMLGRIRSDRVFYLPAPPHPPGTTGRPRRHGQPLALAHPHTWPTPQISTTTQTTRYGQRGRRCLGPAAPTADPPRGLARPPRPAAHHRRHPDPLAGRAPARRPQPQAAVAVVVGHRRQRGRGGQVLAGVPAPVRPRAHLPAVQADTRLDRPQATRPNRGRPVDLADHRRSHPTAARPTPDR
jgi:DDE superfamily endonuclease